MVPSIYHPARLIHRFTSLTTLHHHRPHVFIRPFSAIPSASYCSTQPHSPSSSSSSSSSSFSSIDSQPVLNPSDPTPLLNLPKSVDRTLGSIVDPFRLLETELGHIKQNLKALVGSHDCQLDSIAKYYFSSPHQGKHLRPIIILLIAQATSIPTGPLSYRHPHPHQEQLNRLSHADHDRQNRAINRSISSAEILNDLNPTQPHLTTTPSADRTSNILPSQCRLAEIAELIHVSSLLHDDVIDQALTRRGRASSPSVFGSKLSVLAGDFLLARASMALSRLGNLEVIELISSIISNLVEGELMQLESILRPNSSSSSQLPSAEERLGSDHDGHPSTQFESDRSTINRFNPKLFEFYERKNYLKTASLIAKTCRATVLLSPFINQDSNLIESSHRFGKHLGLAFQIVDDILDYTSTNESSGKDCDSSDLKSGLVTGPGLFAWMEFGDRFGELVHRKFSFDGDLELAQRMVKESNGIERSYRLAQDHIRQCKTELDGLADSESKDGLIRLCDLVLQRTN